MNRPERIAALLKHAWSEPRFVAETQWGYEHSLNRQLVDQIGRHELEHYAQTGQHADPAAQVSLVFHEPPDWDWWEPTTQWRRLAAREREFTASHGAT